MKRNPAIVPTAFRGEPLDVVHLGVSGVLHPSVSTYHRTMRQSPWENGRSRYESAPILERALSHWPHVRIVLTSTLPRRHRFHEVLKDIGPFLANRVIGYTFKDLTEKARVLDVGGAGVIRPRRFSERDYRHMSKAEVVATHVLWLRPNRWMVIDDDPDVVWPEGVTHEQLVLTDPCRGLQEKAAEHRLLMLLMNNFGDPDAPRLGDDS